MSEKVETLADAIRSLTVAELQQLRRLVGEDLGGSTGTREPRRPRPSAPGGERSITATESYEQMVRRGRA